MIEINDSSLNYFQDVATDNTQNNEDVGKSSIEIEIGFQALTSGV